jgi:8-oxo-dGTP diphosphatase
MGASDAEYLHVVAAVIRGDDGRLLLSRRLAHVDQGGLWEFPGGKLQAGEAREAGLARELHEELGIEVARALPLMQVRHRYPTRSVLLDVFVVDRWRGAPQGREGQEVRWFEAWQLPGLEFPAANLPLVTAARLPRICLVTPSPGPEPREFLAGLARCLERGVRLVQLRAPALEQAAYRALAQRVLPLCRAAGAQLILNAEPSLALELGAAGAHLNTARLARCRERPLPREFLLSAACHDIDALVHARALGVDCAFVSPVLPTATHPDATPLGFARLAELAATVSLPIYALGGLGPRELPAAIAAGCVGIAGIGLIWGGAGPFDDATLAAGLTAGRGS